MGAEDGGGRGGGWAGDEGWRGVKEWPTCAAVGMMGRAQISGRRGGMAAVTRGGSEGWGD